MLTQLQVLNLILDKKDYSIISENNLTKEYFPQMSSEFLYIVNHHNKYGQVPDLETFLKSFPSFEVISVTESTDYLINELYREKNESYLASTFNQVRYICR